MADLLFSPPDLDDPANDWANCGPCALAAVLRRSIADVRPLFAGAPSWTTATTMRTALDRARAPHTVLGEEKPLPFYGLALVQISGPWDEPGASAKWAYRFTHWIGIVGHPGARGVYDANVGHWTPEADWADKLMPEVVAHVRESDGRARDAWWVRLAIEIPFAPPATRRSA